MHSSRIHIKAYFSNGQQLQIWTTLRQGQKSQRAYQPWFYLKLRGAAPLKPDFMDPKTICWSLYTEINITNIVSWIYTCLDKAYKSLAVLLGYCLNKAGIAFICIDILHACCCCFKTLCNCSCKLFLHQFSDLSQVFLNSSFSNTYGWSWWTWSSLSGIMLLTADTPNHVQRETV